MGSEETRVGGGCRFERGGGGLKRVGVCERGG